ncbi:MAG: hypothetical protein JSR95_10090 [Proteobacteria bacterium]|nr:hypothetical protein [Pseudomonadota bacterium]
MPRRRLILTGAAILVFGGALAATRTAVDAVHGQERGAHASQWRPGGEIAMSAYEMGAQAVHPPR